MQYVTLCTCDINLCLSSRHLRLLLVCLYWEGTLTDPCINAVRRMLVCGTLYLSDKFGTVPRIFGGLMLFWGGILGFLRIEFNLSAF